MHRILAATFALPLLLGAGAAMAEQATGAVESVDLTRGQWWSMVRPTSSRMALPGSRSTRSRSARR